MILQLKDKKNFELNHSKKGLTIFYYKILKKKTLMGLSFSNMRTKFSKFNDFPIMVKDKKLLIEYLFLKV